MTNNDSYKFANPGLVKIRIRTSDQVSLVDISGSTWTWKDGGTRYSIYWDNYNLQTSLKEALKAFVHSRLQSYSPIVIASHSNSLLAALSKSKYGNTLPWSESETQEFLRSLEGTSTFHHFRMFYKWCVKRNIPGFAKEIELNLSAKSNREKSYRKISMNEVDISKEIERKIWDEINSKDLDEKNMIELRDNILLHISFEIAPRPIQIFSLDISDLEIFKSDTGEHFYTLWLPMAKKRSVALPERRPRSITKSLGEKLKKLIDLISSSSAPSQGLFLKEDGTERLPTFTIGRIISLKLKSFGLKKGDGAVTLRHHLGQGLADQGAPADIIAEMLGHNSTVAARAYIAATPEISNIKARALGKNQTYLNIMKMMLTGEIIEKSSAAKNRWVTGMVGHQYIGEIGSCGLRQTTPCPKNPIYSCYTCSKFHPFSDGSHDKVKEALTQQAQYFINIAENAMDIDKNRAVIQLEDTINAVDSIIIKCTSR